MAKNKMAEVRPLEDIHVQFHNGVQLDRKSYLVLKTSTGCSAIDIQSRVVPARSLSITWGDDTRYWRWLLLENDVSVEVAELLDVCWLEVIGTYQMKDLKAGHKYEVLFDILLKDPSGLEPAATFKLEIPGEVQEKKLSLQKLKPQEWIQVKVGDFVAKSDGEIRFSMTDYKELNWKRGLVIAGVTIQVVS